MEQFSPDQTRTERLVGADPADNLGFEAIETAP